MEISVNNDSLPNMVPSKQELDESITQGKKPESGIFSDNFTDNSSLSDKPTWEWIEGEVCDARIFDPPIACSSNVWADPLSCDLSSIFELTPPTNSTS